MTSSLRGQFNTGASITVGTFPDSIAAGDLNNDGKVDLVTTNQRTNDISLLLGDGAGGFKAASGSPIPVGAGPDSVVLGDVNGDGNLDIVVANSSGNSVTVLLGNGVGGFTASPGSPFAVGGAPSVVVIFDCNGDGKSDLATANSQSNNVSVLLGNGSGGFTRAPGGPFAVGSAPQYMGAADFNADGKLDLITTNFSSNNISILLGDGTGSFKASQAGTVTTGSGPNGIAVGDFNGDGRPDIAIPNFSSGNITVLLGSNSGGFAAASGSPFAAGRGPTSITAGDFNGDGRLDLATTNYSSNNQTILLGNGAGGFAEAPGSPFASGTGPTKVVSIDVNRDGRPDLATSNGTSNTVTILLNGFPALSTPAITPGGVGPVYSTSTAIQAGSWVSIYGNNLAASTSLWNGDFPVSLGGVTVTINGKPSYLWFVSPNQINLQAPDDIALGPVDVVVTNAAGTFTSKVSLAAASPAFSLLGDGKHAAGVIATPGGNGAYGGGTYDLVGPSGAFPFRTRPVKAGETLILYGVGFGPTSPPVAAGKVFSGAAPTAGPVTVAIGGVPAAVAFSGITAAGLYQFNVTVPANTGSGERALFGSVSGVPAQLGALVTVE